MGQSPCCKDTLREFMIDNDQRLQAFETIGTESGLSVRIIDVGAKIQSIKIPAPDGTIDAALS